MQRGIGKRKKNNSGIGKKKKRGNSPATHRTGGEAWTFGIQFKRKEEGGKGWIRTKGQKMYGTCTGTREEKKSITGSPQKLSQETLGNGRSKYRVGEKFFLANRVFRLWGLI